MDLFSLAEKRLNWLDTRQAVLAQNVANADTPGFAAKDIAPFSKVLSGVEMAPWRTSALHQASSTEGEARAREIRPHERAPDGNSVSVEHELASIAEIGTSQQLVTNLYRKYASMIRTTLGKNG
jgi:flagellar basal-body rod protein FlgB